MSEAFRNRHTFDLDEIERQIREASSRPPGAGKPVEDPLAELARIVSGDTRPRREPAAEHRAAAPAAVSPRDLSDAVAREFAHRRPANEHHEAARPDAEQGALQGSLTDNIERLLHREPPAAAPVVHPDDFAEVMRSFDRIVERHEPVPPQAAADDARNPAELERELAAMIAAPPAAAPSPVQPAPIYLPHAGGYPPQQHDHGPDETQPEPPYAYPEAIAPLGQSRSRRKSLMLAAAVAGVAVIGVGGALSMRGGGGIQGNGQAPIIRAAEGPSKIAPVNPGGADIPDQNRQILERSQGKPAAAATKVVASEEPPLDLKEAVRKESANGAAALGTAAAPRVVLSSPVAAPATTGSASAANAAEPRKVKTVVIRPETPAPATAAVVPPVAAAPVVAAPAPVPVAAAPAPSPVAATPAPKAADPAPAPATPAAQAAKPKPKPAVTADARRTEPPRRTPAPADEPEATGSNPNAPISIVPTGAPKRNQRLQQVAAAAPAVASDAQPARASGGSFVVQLASEGSDGEARSAANRFKGRFAELGDYSANIQQREVNGQMRYRVRFGAMSREDANSLCSALKGKGQACIIQPN